MSITISASEAANLVPYTDILRHECPRVRILVVGKSGAGKSALINAVFGVEATAVSESTPGTHDIEEGLTFKGNDRIIIHDSQGFETGEADNLQKALDFIDRRSKEPALRDQLHGIWFCAEIPFASNRLFEKGAEELLQSVCRTGSVPVIVVFTKLDILREHREGRLEEHLTQTGETMDDALFESEIDTIVQNDLRTLCIEPLCALVGTECKWSATSNHSSHQKTIVDLVKLALEETQIENVWIEFAIAQRSQAKASIEACTRIGKKRYWRAIFSDNLPGVRMKDLLNTLLKDIVTAWNMEDPKDLLKQPDFLALVSILVEDLSESKKEQTTGQYPLTKMAVKAGLENPAAVIIAAPAAVIFLFAEWVRGTYKTTRACFRCLMGFLVDLTLTMDTLFYLHLSCGWAPIRIGQINQALTIYSRRSAPVHASIRSYTNAIGPLAHFNPKAAIDKISSIIEKHRVKPEDWSIKDADREEIWMPVDELRAK